MARSQFSLLRERSAEPAMGPVPAPLERLRRTACVEIDRHVRRDGRCAICGTPFPCDRAVLAELALGLF
jgi:hypothetical protein